MTVTDEEYIAALDANVKRGLRWRRLDVALSVMGCLVLAGIAIARIAGLTLPLVFQWIGAGSIVASLVPWHMYNRSIRRVPVIMSERMLKKTYPEGCTCVRGFMFANLSCPHHQDGGMR